MSILKEFKTFVSRGNVVDLAVGVIMGAAFGKIVSSLVADVIMPPVGLLMGRVNFTDLKFVIGGGVGTTPVTINYGTFLQTTLDFLIIAGAIFLLVQGINRLKRQEAAKPEEEKPPLSPEEKLLTEIRDLLAARTVLPADATPSAAAPSPRSRLRDEPR